MLRHRLVANRYYLLLQFTTTRIRAERCTAHSLAAQREAGLMADGGDGRKLAAIPDYQFKDFVTKQSFAASSCAGSRVTNFTAPCKSASAVAAALGGPSCNER
jgi:hypothetical protein